ncbi:branched-chain amino acid ABC transporter permease [Natronorarus salvus]|uniref:branched-chain amino acid ABC transporter permease n=1 Tax=Natronorarus salvus TaxID=3117733 RepID=UPI002F26A17D
MKLNLQTITGKLLVAGFAFALVYPFIASRFALDVGTQALIFILVVTSWNFIAGYLGILSFVHAALFGVGGYAGAMFAAEMGVPAPLAILLAGVVTGVFSLPMAVSVLHLRGAYVAMLTIAYAEIIFLTAIIWRGVTGGPTGYSGFPMLFGGDRVMLYYFTLVVVTVLVGVLYLITVNRFGLVARAIRESEEAAQMLGNNTRQYKLIGFVIGSIMAGVAGGLQAYNILVIAPPMFELERMIEFMAMGIVGGLRTISGGIFGTLVVFGLSEALRPIGTARLLIWGILLIVAIIFVPNGIVGRGTGVDNSRNELVSQLRELIRR